MFTVGQIKNRTFGETLILKAKKSYGQHFLRSEAVAQSIAESLIHFDKYEEVLEIGPGQGMLTQFLINRPYQLKVVEADRDMVQHLRNNFVKLQECIIAQDVLKVKLQEHFTGQFAIIGNFPYNISSQILFKVLDYKEQVPEMVGMFQKEVAKRVTADAGSKIYGVISVLVQAYYDTEYLFELGPEEFIPSPKVDSAVIRLSRKDKIQLDCDESLFKSVVKVTFGQRRKMLRKTLKAFTKHKRLQEDDFFQRRPETLSVEDFITLTKWLDEVKS